MSKKIFKDMQYNTAQWIYAMEICTVLLRMTNPISTFAMTQCYPNRDAKIA